MVSIDIRREYLDAPPDERQARARRILDILQRYRALLLTPQPVPPKIEIPQEGNHD